MTETKRKWTRMTDPRRPFDGYETEGAEVTDNGNGFGSTVGSGRWAVTVRGRWLANVDGLVEAKALAERTLDA